MEASPNVALVADQVTQAALQAGQQVHALAMQNAVHFQQLAQTASLQLLSGGMQVGQSYQGNHLRRGAEVDSQESVAEGAIYKGESQASFPQTGQQLDALYHKDALKGVVGAVVAEVLAKIGASVPPQTAGHAAQAPASRAQA